MVEQLVDHRGHEEGRADGRGIETEHGLQDERGTDRRVDGRMGAGEHEAKPFVRNGRRLRHGFLQLLGEEGEMHLAGLGGPVAAGRIDGAAAGGGDQPAFGIVGDAIRGPVGERRGEGVCQRVLGGGDVTGAAGEEGDELAVAAACDGFRRRPSIGAVAFRHAGQAFGFCISMSGRTSITPVAAPGQRPAQERAASRSGTSMR